MSFSSEVKKELCSVNAVDTEQKKAELYGLLIFSKVFKKDKIVLTTENSDVSKKVTDLLEELYMPIIEKETTLRVRTTEHHLSKISLINADDCLRIFDDYGHHDNDISLRVNRANISCDELVAAFLRGAFEGCGSVSDPMKSYHAEFCVPHKNLSVDLCKILSEIPECDFYAENKKVNISKLSATGFRQMTEASCVLSMFDGLFKIRNNCPISQWSEERRRQRWQMLHFPER